MSVSISSISKDAARLVQLCQTNTSQIQTAGKVGELVKRHQALKKEYDAFQKKIVPFLSSIAEDETLLIRTTQIQDSAAAAWKGFEEKLLTVCPQAPIEIERPLVGPIVESSELLIHPTLLVHFPYYRSVRGDGNCFYTSLSITYLEWLCQHPEHFEFVLKQIFELPDFPGKNELIPLLLNLQENPTSFENFIHSDPNMFMFISFLRHATAEHLKKMRNWRGHYSPEFPKDPPTADEYISDHVLKMGCDAQHIEINAITSFLKCQLWIFDGQNGITKLNEDFAPFIGALYHFPGHYAHIHLESVPPPTPEIVPNVSAPGASVSMERKTMWKTNRFVLPAIGILAAAFTSYFIYR
jgi:hypothetical protein